jgi:ankyrin repeat protein
MKTGDSILHLAVYEDKVGFIKAILDNEQSAHAIFELEEINIKNEDGNTPLSYACISGNLELVKLLHSKGANLRHKNAA